MKLTRLELLEVVTEDGRRLGRVFDLRLRAAHRGGAERAPGQVEELVYGATGLLERLGVRRGPAKTLPWRDVVAIRDGRLVVRDPLSSRAGRSRRRSSASR